MSERDYILHHIDQQGRVVRSNQDECMVCIYYHDDVMEKTFEEATCRYSRPLTADQKPDGTRASWCINGAFEYVEGDDNVSTDNG
jgi:hypothetical protein